MLSRVSLLSRSLLLAAPRPRVPAARAAMAALSSAKADGADDGAAKEDKAASSSDGEAKKADGDDAKADASSGDDASALRTENAALQRDLARYKDEIVRTIAEMDNVQRQMQRRLDESRKFAVEKLARDLLDVADNLERAAGAGAADAADDAAAAAKKVAALVEGVRLTERELLSVLRRHDITRVETMGLRFDPEVMEAVFEAPATEDAQPGTVMHEVAPGYTIAGRLLRAAKVGLARAAE
jgi:molecular chaperone GrpE